MRSYTKKVDRELYNVVINMYNLFGHLAGYESHPDTDCSDGDAMLIIMLRNGSREEVAATYSCVKCMNGDVLDVYTVTVSDFTCEALRRITNAVNARLVFGGLKCR